MTFDPRGFEKAMKRAVCPHYGDKPVCDACSRPLTPGDWRCGRPGRDWWIDDFGQHPDEVRRQTADHREAAHGPWRYPRKP